MPGHTHLDIANTGIRTWASRHRHDQTYTMTLFDAEPDPPFTLWHRETRRHKWRVFATGETALAALAPIAGKGEWMLVGPEVYDPNETCLAEVRRRGAVVPAVTLAGHESDAATGSVLPRVRGREVQRDGCVPAGVPEVQVGRDGIGGGESAVSEC